MPPPPKNGQREYADDDTKWRAIVAKDSHADEHFCYSVQSTGIYCLPSCSSRLPLRKNVRFHDSPLSAEKAGFRPCKRCSPNGPTRAHEHAGAVAKACRAIDAAESLPKLATLAKVAGMSSFHFHRVFRKIVGVTPKAYAMARRAERLREALPACDTVTEAIYRAGFPSNGRFYAKAGETLGMTPTTFRKGGTGTSIRFAVGDCALGSVLVAATQTGVCAILLGDDPDLLVRELQHRFPHAELIGADKSFEQTVARVIGCIDAPTTPFDLPLDVSGTAFQQKVWQALRDIPLGATVSYTTIAKRIGAPTAMRAVAQACAANPIAVAIPCHRVVRHDGSLSGYRWGIARKRALLAREGQVSP